MAPIQRSNQEGKQTSQICIRIIIMIVEAWKLCLDMLSLGVKPLNQWVNAQTLCFVLTRSKGLQWVLSDATH